MHDTSANPPLETATAEDLDELYDNPLERLQLLAGDDTAIAAFLDEIEVPSPREREMLAEIARSTPLARPDRFEADQRRVVVALESLRRHGHHGSRAGAGLGPGHNVIRFLVELVARYVVVTHVKKVAMNLRNLYWLREMEATDDSPEQQLLQQARLDGQALVEITRSRELGVPTFVLGGLLIPAGLSLWRLASGFTFEHWWTAVLAGAAAVLVGLGISWIVLHGAALAGRRIRRSVGEPLRELWLTVGACGFPPKDRSRRFAVVAISLTVGVWIVLPLLVTLSLAT
ncbi:hypothetical protein BH09ACT13_BH09ACT13_12990 [soil metagenome]